MLRISFIILGLMALSCHQKDPLKDLKTVSLLPGHTREQHEFLAKNHIIASQGVASSQAGLEMLKAGGNIIDAAVAVSFAISVERPQSTGIGGGGFLIFYQAKEQKAYGIDFREMAPLKSHEKMFLDDSGKVRGSESVYGGLAVGVPGLVAGLFEIHQKWGSLSWKKVMAPSIKLAKEGLPLYPHLREAIIEQKSRLLLDPDSKKIFFLEGEKVPPLGHLIVQKDLANTLEKIALSGPEAFYQGEVAKNIVSSVNQRGGIFSLEDLANYEVKWRAPLTGEYKGFKVISMPPPSSGGAHVIEILNLLEKQNLKQYGPQGVESLHKMATAMQIAFADRAKYMGDSDFVKVPLKELTSKAYAHKRQKEFNEQAIPSSKLPGGPYFKEPTDTTHFTLATKNGDVVVSTQTINAHFGAVFIAKDTGVVMNNEMDDFATKVGASNIFGAIGGEKNLAQPKKRPLSSMSPTIVLKEGKPFLALGTPSGTRIITCVAQTILNVLEFELPLYEAVAATRIHHQWYPENIRIGEPGLDEVTLHALKSKGHDFLFKNQGCKVQAVQQTKKGEWLGVSDPRGEGLVIGL